MASKSKKRRRVLGASCILAALIIAGSSFAWFTSKDEVTNRLTASANYGVSAIENFVPPKQFTPGQTVTKEEAVVNTGSIDAFVKQKITGDMKVSVEVPTVTAPTNATATAENYLELNEQERFGTYEAGSTLAWAPDGSKYREGDKMKDGGLIIDYGIDGATAENHGFVPDKTGLYIFRRNIVKDGNNQTTNYEYVGYYFIDDDDNDATTGGKYYKLYALTVPKTVLDEDSDGLLKGAPTVSYSRKIETSVEKVDMTFLKPGDVTENGVASTDYRLKVQYSTDDIVNGEVANQARKANAQKVYDDYNAYLDYLQGATTYVPTNTWAYANGARSTDLRAHDASNPTGLIDHDIHLIEGSTNGNKTPDNDTLTNFSYKRLEDLKYGENRLDNNYEGYDTDGKRVGTDKTGKDASQTTTVGNAATYGLEGLYNFYSPVMSAYSGQKYGAFIPFDATEATSDTVNHGTVDTIEKAWTAAQNEANRSRQLINTGINAAADLATLKSAVETAIGRNYNDTGVGLRLTRTASSTDPVGSNTWTAEKIYQAATEHALYNLETQKPNVSWKEGSTGTDYISFANRSANITDANELQRTLSGDTVFETRFKDVGKDSTFGDQSAPKYATETAGSQVMFIEATNGPTASGTLKTKWDAYVQQTKRQMLVDKKIELVNNCLTIATETDSARDKEEAERALVLLRKEKAEIDKDYNEAKKAYEDAAKEVADNIQKMNELQAMVDAANNEYKDYILSGKSGYDYIAHDANVNSTALDNKIISVIAAGANDSPVEDILKDCLKNTYGVAHKADAPAPTYTSATNTTIHQTYSRPQTIADIDKYTTTNSADGTTAFDITTFDGSEFENDGNETDVETAVKNAPYFRLNQADNMMAYRDKQVKDKKADFDAGAAQMALFDADETRSSEGIVIYVGLGDVFYNVPNTAPTEDTDEHKWQYVGDATTDKSAKEFDFGYTSILEAGETSSQLIKYVKFDDAVTQKDFLDMTFDVNVGVESAQVAYNGTIAGAEAARSSLTPIVPSAESYVTSDKVVGWVAKDGNVSPTDTDPDPKTEATDAVGTKYTMKVNGAVVDDAVTKITPVIIEGEAYEYKYVDTVNNKAYYSKTLIGTYKQVEDDDAATKTFNTNTVEVTANT